MKGVGRVRLFSIKLYRHLVNECTCMYAITCCRSNCGMNTKTFKHVKTRGLKDSHAIRQEDKEKCLDGNSSIGPVGSKKGQRQISRRRESPRRCR